MHLDSIPSHSIHFTNAPDIREILCLEGRTVILPASFIQSYVLDITRNRQVIQVYSSLVGSSDLKIANRNNNLFTIMIINNPTIHYSRSVENMCIPMITRFDRLMLVFKDLSDFKHRIFRHSMQRITKSHKKRRVQVLWLLRITENCPKPWSEGHREVMDDRDQYELSSD